MEKIKDIYESCDIVLSSIVKMLKESLVELSKEKSTNHNIYMAFTDLVRNWQECTSLTKLITKCYEFYQEVQTEKNMTELQNYISQYQKCKSRIFIIIGSLKESSKIDITEQLEKYMSKCDDLSQVSKLITTSKITDMDLLESESDESKSEESHESHESQKSKHDVEDDESISFGDKSDSDSDKSNITEKDLLGDDILKEAKEGGINELSDVTVLAGEDKHIVGEKFKFHTRDLMLRIKNSDSREEQLKHAGFDYEEDLDGYMSKLKIDEHVRRLIKQYEVDELYVKSLENLRQRVQIYCTKMGNTNKTVADRFKRVIKSIEECIQDTLYPLKLDLPLYNLVKCYCAAKFENEKFTKQMKLLDSPKTLLKGLVEKMKKSNIGEMPTFDHDWEVKLTDDDNLRNYINLQRKWIKPMSEIEIYFGRMSEYIDQLWNVYDEKNISPECAKYRIYLLKSGKWSKSDTSALEKIVDKYNIVDYSDMKKFISATADS